MQGRRPLAALRAVATATAVTLVAFVLSANATAATTSTSCTRSPYAYAGLIAQSSSSGIKATITATAHAIVREGHVAGWIGVGGPSAGPNREAEWLQVGLNVMAGGRAEIYGELTLPGDAPVYTALGQVAVGTAYRLAIVELQSRPGTWQILLNGKPASRAVYLPGSHGSFRPMAMTESWNADVPSCNDFSYRFDSVTVAGHGSWERLTPRSARTLSDTGYQITMTNAGFVAGRNV